MARIVHQTKAPHGLIFIFPGLIKAQVYKGNKQYWNKGYHAPQTVLMSLGENTALLQWLL